MTTRIQIGDRVKPTPRSKRIITVTAIHLAPYLTKQPTIVEGVDDKGRTVRAALIGVTKIG
jgi:hypothetical protein